MRQPYKLLLTALITLVICILIIILVFSLLPKTSVGPCDGYEQVGTYEGNINSEIEAKQIAIVQYNTLGFEFTKEELDTWQVKKAWFVRSSTGSEGEYCHVQLGELVPENCYGTLKFQGNKVYKRYIIPC